MKKSLFVGFVFSLFLVSCEKNFDAGRNEISIYSEVEDGIVFDIDGDVVKLLYKDEFQMEWLPIYTIGGQSWRLPTEREISQLSSDRKKLNKALRQAGGDKFGGNFYWYDEKNGTSEAERYSFDNKMVWYSDFTYNKNYARYVREDSYNRLSEKTDSGYTNKK